MERKKGFSLLEIIIFCFISIILITLVMGMVSNSREFSRTVGCINNMKMITQAIEQFQADHQDTPVSLATLYPHYITSNATFKCPADRDRASLNSYERIYVGRSANEKDTHKMFLACYRHNNNSKSVVAYLSYAVDIEKNQKVTLKQNEYDGLPIDIEYGHLCTGGVMTFADGTEIKITGTAAPLASFISNQDRIYSVVYVPDKANTTLEITHHGDSIFEIVTPAIIAGVKGTKFTVKTLWIEDSGTDNPKNSTTVTINEGAVRVAERSADRQVLLSPDEKNNETFGNTITIQALGWKEKDLPTGLLKKTDDQPGKMNFVPRKPFKTYQSSSK